MRLVFGKAMDAGRCWMRWSVCAPLVLAAIVLFGGRSRAQDESPAHEVHISDSLALAFQYDSAIVRLRSEERTLRHSADRVLYYRCLDLWADALLWKTDYREADSLAQIVEKNAPAEIGGDEQELAFTYSTLGCIRSYQERYTDAIGYYGRSIAIYVKKRGRIDRFVAGSYVGLQDVYRRAGKYDLALACLDTAMRIQQAVLGNLHYDIAQSLLAKGDVYLFSRRYRMAIEAYQSSLAMLDSLHKSRSPFAGLLYSRLGSAHADCGNFDQAVAADMKALELNRALFGENHMHVAMSLRTLAEDMVSRGDYATAQSLLEEALAIYSRLVGSFRLDILSVNEQLARLHAIRGELGEAVALIRESVRGDSSLQGEENPMMASTYEQAATILRKRGDRVHALVYYRKSLAVMEKGYGARANIASAGTQELVGETLCESGELDQADSELARSQRMQDSCDVAVPLLRCATFTAQGHVAERRHNVPLALARYQSALGALSPGFADSVADPDPPGGGYDLKYVEVLARKARLLEATRDRNRQRICLERALASYEHACLATERLMKGYRSEGSKLFMQTTAFPLYSGGLALSERLLALTGDRRYRETAFRFAERSKSAVLREGMQESRAVHFADVPDSVVEEESRLSKTIAGLQVAEQIAEDGREDGDHEHIKRRLFEVNEEMHGLQSMMQQRYPGYARLLTERQDPSLAAVQSSLGGDECLVEYVLAGSALHTLVIARDTVSILVLHPRSSVEVLARDLVNSIKTLDKGRYIAAARALYNLLFRPVERRVSRYRKITVVPSGILYYVPFEVLLTGPVAANRDQAPGFASLPYLVLRHDIRYTFSAMIFAEGAESLRTSPRVARTFAGFAPVFDDTASRYERPVQAFASREVLRDARSITLDGRTFAPLPFSENEVHSIVDGFRSSGNRGIGFIRADATKQNFLAAAGQYTILHIASHGFVNESHPEISALLFYPSGHAASPEDAVLYARETYDLHLNADLVVLSSCESGIGKLVRGEGLMAMTRGFFYAGARNLIVSLWKVSDRHTGELMKEFYRRAIAGEGYGEALREAKLSMIRDEATACPLKWAGFVLLGM